MADEKTPETPAPKIAPQTAAGQTAGAPAARWQPGGTPRMPHVPLRRRARQPRRFPISRGKTTTAASAGGAAAKAAATAAKPAAAAATRDPDDTSPLLTRRAWMGVAWGAFTAASAAALAATGRFMFPNVLNEPPQQFKAGFPTEYGDGRGRALEGEVRRLDRPHAERHRAAGERVLRAARDLHAPGLHAELPGGRRQVQVPVPRQRLPDDSGINFEGPAPRPLERARIVLADDGQLLSTRRASSSTSWGSGPIRRRFSRLRIQDLGFERSRQS